MSEPGIHESQMAESEESFGSILSQFERGQAGKSPAERQTVEGTVVAVSAESVLVDIGFKTEGVLPLSAFQGAPSIKPGDKLSVGVKGRNADGYYELTRVRAEQPKDWSALERAFAERTPIAGTVTGVVKGGLSVDVGVRAFMPASRTGARDAAEMEKLVGQEVRCRITKLEVADENVVVDRRAILEEEERAAKQRRYSEIRQGETVRGTVRSLMDYGAFVDIGGVDALLHVSDISWSRVNKPADALQTGDEIEVKILKVDPDKRRISVGLKQLQPHPWDAVAEKYKAGERVRGLVTRTADFGAFVELEPGVEGLIHISEMSWSKRVRKPTDVVKPGETVEAVILGVNTTDRRISLGLKQALGDPWADVPERFPVGAIVEGPVVSLTNFGAFVQLSEGVEGMVHISDITAEKRIRHPQEVLKAGERVKAQVLAIDSQKRQLRLGMKQLIPTGLDEYVKEHKEGDVVTGRMTDVSGDWARVELGEGILASCRIAAQNSGGQEAAEAPKSDVSLLSSMLNARWKGSAVGAAQQEGIRTGQVRSFRIAKLDPAAKLIELELA